MKPLHHHASVATATVPATPALAASSHEYAAALAAVTPELQAMPPEQLLPVNLDLSVVCTTAGGKLPDLLALGPQFETLPDLDRPLIDKLPVYLRAVAFAHASYLYSTQTASPLPALAADCEARFAVLEHAAQTFIDEGLLPAETLSAYGKEQGYRPRALEMLHLTALLRTHEPPLPPHPSLTAEKLDAAALAGSKLFEAVGERDRLESTASDATHLRQRAFSRFARAWDEARRAVLYLRWHHGDADILAPSLYVGRGAPHAKEAPNAPTPAAPVAPAAPAKPDALLDAMTGDASKMPNFASVVPRPFGNK